MNIYKFTEKYITELEAGLQKLPLPEIARAVALLTEARSRHARVFLCGNGGSATLASHMATDLQLAGLAAIPLTDIAAVTTYANDVDFTACFQAQLQRLAQAGDILIGISGSGNSTNVVDAMDYAGSAGLHTIAVVGMTGGSLLDPAFDVVLHVEAAAMPQSQDLHQVVLHVISYALMHTAEVA